MGDLAKSSVFLPFQAGTHKFLACALPAAAHRLSPKAASKVETTSMPGSGRRGKNLDLGLVSQVAGFGGKVDGQKAATGDPGGCFQGLENPPLILLRVLGNVLVHLVGLVFLD